MLEFARGVFRFEQHKGAIDDMTPEDQRNLLMAAELAAEQPANPSVKLTLPRPQPSLDTSDSAWQLNNQTACPLGQAELFCVLRGCKKTEDPASDDVPFEEGLKKLETIVEQMEGDECRLRICSSTTRRAFA